MLPRLMCIGFVLAAASFSADSGIVGRVLDPQGRSVAGATVRLQAGASNATAISDEQGQFRITSVSPGPSRLIVEAAGFQSRGQDVVVPAHGMERVDVTLPGIARQQQSIVISGKAVEPAVDLRNAEVFERTLFTRDDQVMQQLNAGIDAGQHEGGGKSLEIRRFGFNLDHGGVNGGLKALVDDVQQNQATQGHGQGYLGALKALSPELIQDVEIINGPFSAEYGDFSGLGVVHIRQRESLPDEFTVRLEGGEFDTGRAFLAYSPDAQHLDSYLAYEGSYTDGPFQNPGRYRRDNFNANYTKSLSANEKVGVRLLFGRNDFFSSGQIPLDLVSEGVLDRFGFIDPSDGGRVRLGTISAYYSKLGANGDTFKADGFLSRSLFDLYSDFTFYLHDPVNGDAFQQHDSRLQQGLNAQYTHPHRFGSAAAVLVAGSNFHDNEINVGLYPREGRVPTGVTTRANAHVTNGAGYAQENLSLFRGRLLLGAGIRFDEFRFGVVDKANPDQSGVQWAGRWQGKGSAAFTPATHLPLTFTGNYGRGINSADARGVVQRPDQPRLATTDFYQIGASSNFGRLGIATDAFLIDHSNEQVYVPDDGSFEFKGPSRAYGYEAKASVALTRRLSLNGGLTKIGNAFFRGGDHRVYVDSAPHFVANAALTLAAWHGWSGSLRMRAINHYRLDGEDPSIVASGHTVFDLGIAKQVRPGVELNLSLDNLTNRDYYETQNYFESRVSPDAPIVARIHGTPGYPLTAVAGVTFRLRGKCAAQFGPGPRYNGPTYRPPMARTGTGTTMTVLLADGDPRDRAALRRILEQAGFFVRETISDESPELILLHSADLCRRFKQDPLTRHIPILQLHRLQARHSAPEDAADACLTDPVEPGALIAVAELLVRARRAEQRADEARRKYQAALDAIGCGAALLDSSGVMRQVNRALCELVGKRGEELIGKHYLDAPPGVTESEEGLPFDRARRSLRRQFAEIEAGGRCFRVEVDPLLDGSGAFAGAVRTVEDITGRKTAEQERERLLSQLASERARLETVLQQMPAGVIMAEAPSGKLVLINGRVESIFRGPFRIGGGTKDYLQYPAFRPNGRAYRPDEHPLARTIQSGEVITDEEMEFVRADGTRAAVLVSSAPIRSPEGSIIAGVLTVHDVTERTQLEHQLRQAQKMEAMGRLAGGVAHDFNNLLTVIGGYGQMVRDALDPKNPMRKDLEAILEASDRASTLTRQLLTFSRRQMVEPRVLDLNRHIARVGRMLRRVIREDVELVTILKADPARIKADPAQIEQVLLNVAVNARDAMPKGGKLTVETAFVDASAEAVVPGGVKPGQYVALFMADTGTGMDAETQSHLFEPFFTTKSKGKGTGLGLSTVYGIVKQNGGEIVIDSEVGRGTTVRVYFPLAEERVRAGGVLDRRPAARPGTETILVVEDDGEVRKLAAEMLSRQGYAVLEAASGPEALRLWRRHAASIDLLLSDVVMPSMAGPELALTLTAERPDLKVLYMSGYPEEIMAKHGLTASESTFIHKPFTSDALVHSVRLVLDGERDA